MSFASFGFLLAFLPVALTGFWAASRSGPAAAMAWLLACSVAFYPAEYWPVLAASMLGNAVLGRWVRATEGTPAQTAVLAIGIGLNLAGMAAGRTMHSVPPGISFIAFAQIGWLLDQRGADLAEPHGGRRPAIQDISNPSRGWRAFARHDGTSSLAHPLLVLFFPHLIAGPILRVRDVEAQFADPRTWRLTGENLASGGTILLIGLLKKTLLANPLGIIVAPGFADPGSLGFLATWGTALAWSFQLYFDFSGYSDMAVGLARMFGVRFPANFDSPYKSQSVIDYWQRWHMTLTQFLMSTVYNPLVMAAMRRRRALGMGVGRAAQRTVGGFGGMLLGPLAATMVLAGIWHGATLPYLAFGLIHAGYLGVNHAWRIFRLEPRSQAWGAVVGRVVLTYLCVLLASVVFRAPSLDVAGTLFAGMIGLHPAGPYLHGALHALWLAGLGAIVWGMPNTQRIVDGAIWRPTLPWAMAAGCAATLGILALGGTHEFVYFQF
jgi:alginate O-acetyltransferase complex protein AlgI